MVMIKNKASLCPCGSNIKYALCCGKYHKGKLHAPTAESLMRSRYSAYALDLHKYIFRTWDQQTRPTLQSLGESRGQEFTKLTVLSSIDGTENDNTGEVEFIAEYQIGNKHYQIKEHSLFQKNGKRWIYVKAITDE